MKDVHGLMPSGNENRVRWLDQARAVAMLFILLGHAGVSIAFISRFSLLFYVPVFFVAAGCVYRRREESFGAFVKRRAARLLIPYFQYSCFLLLFYYLKELAAGSLTLQKAVWPLLGVFYGRNGLYPPDNEGVRVLMTVWNSPLWFLPALFLSEVLFGLIERAASGERRKLAGVLCICSAAGVLIHYRMPVLLPWSLDCIPLFAVWIGAGYLVYPHVMQIRKYSPLLLAAAVLCAWKNGILNVSVGSWGGSLLFGMAGTLCASILLLYGCFRLDAGSRMKQPGQEGQRRLPPVLTAVGQNTLPILGLHLFVFMWIQGAAEHFLPKTMQEGMADQMWRTGMALAAVVIIMAGTYGWKKWTGKVWLSV